MHRWLDAVLDGPVAAQLTELVAQLNPHAESDALGQKLLALTVPGIPDVYQGTELWDDSLVDPDNRRPVDYAARRQALKSLQHPKIRVVTAALRLRRARPDTFLRGDYRPVLARREPRPTMWWRSVRGDDVLVAVTPLDGAARPKPAGATPFDAARRLVDRRADRRGGQRAGRRPPSCSPSCRWHCWSAADG